MRTHKVSATIAVSFLMFASVCLIGCDGQRNVSDRDIEFVSRSEVRELLADQAAQPGEPRVILLDPRPVSDYVAGHLPTARSLLLSGVQADEGRDPLIRRYENIIVYGEHPSSAVAAALAKRMMRIKYDDVRVYDGGVADWTAAGLPLEQGTPAGNAPPIRRPLSGTR
ncbi:MAG: rhodanese-like domain-containing protein [Planctomycetota bacterium]